MKKRVITAIVLIVILIAALIGFIFTRNSKTDKDNTTDTDTDTVTAADIAPYMGKSEDEVQDIMDTPLTDEQLEAFNQIEADNFVPIGVEALPDDDPTDNKYQIVDAEGNIYEVEDPILGMTDEEIAEMQAKFKEQLADDSVEVIDAFDQPDYEYDTPDKELEDMGMEKVEMENTDDGHIYVNTNIEEDNGGDNSTTGSLKIDITDSSELASGFDGNYVNGHSGTISGGSGK